MADSKKSGEWISSPEYIVCNLCGMGLKVGDYTKEEQMKCFKFCPCCGNGMKWVVGQEQAIYELVGDVNG